MILDESESKKILKTWSKEVSLFFLDRGPYRCQCGSDYQLTVGNVDRVRCAGCNVLLIIEI